MRSTPFTPAAVASRPIPSNVPNPGSEASEAAWQSEQQLLALPKDVQQIDCRPGMPTFPPFTRLSGFSAGFYILSDGRCFVDPAATPFFLNITPKP